MQQQLESLQLPYRIFNACDGQSLSESQLHLYSPQHAFKLKGRELSKGEIGCALTHASIYQEMVSSDLNEVLILEDDIILKKSLLKVLMQRELFPPDWEAINFANTWAKPRKVLGEPLWKNHRICTFKRIANRTSAYLLNRQGATKLAEHSYPIRLPADDLLGRTKMTGIHLYGITPSVVGPADFESTIVPDGAEAAHDLRKNTVWRRLQRRTNMYLNQIFR